MKKAGDIVSRTELKEYLTKAVETGNISHAYLFTGEKGSGKLLLAQYFADAMLCTGVILSKTIVSKLSNINFQLSMYYLSVIFFNNYSYFTFFFTHFATLLLYISVKSFSLTTFAPFAAFTPFMLSVLFL